MPAEQTPTTWNATAHGCANFTVYTEDQSGRRFLVVTAVKKELGLENLGDTATVDLATKVSGPSTEVYVDTYARVPTEQGYCSDIRDFYEPDQAKAIGGLATFTIAGVGREGGAYAVTVSLRGVTVRAATGALEKIPDVTYTMVNVGWLPG